MALATAPIRVLRSSVKRVDRRNEVNDEACEAGSLASSARRREDVKSPDVTKPAAQAAPTVSQGYCCVQAGISERA